MGKYEINVWKDATLLSKELVAFDSDEDCFNYVNNKYNGPDTWTGTHVNLKTGVLRWRPPPGICVTWGNANRGIYKPKKLTSEEKELQNELYNSIPHEVVNEVGYNEMIENVSKDYYGHPDAKGLEDKK